MRLHSDKPNPLPEDSHVFKIQPNRQQQGKQPETAPQAAFGDLDFLASPGGETPSACRWRAADFPLAVWFEENPETPDFEGELFGMLGHWAYASDNRLRFVKAESEEEADVTITWFDEPVLGRDFELGHTDRTVIPNPDKTPGQPEGIITFVNVNLHKKPLKNVDFCAKNAHFSSENAQKTRFFATILHEFGHVLGLEHSTNPTDTMFHRGFQNARLSDNDIRRLKLLYKDV